MSGTCRDSAPLTKWPRLLFPDHHRHRLSYHHLHQLHHGAAIVPVIGGGNTRDGHSWLVMSP